MSNRKLLCLSVYLCIGLSLTLSTARSESIITEWNPIIISAVVRDRPAPTPSTHVMSTVFSAAYEAWAAYDPVALGAYAGNTLDVTAGSVADKEESISHAIYAVLSSWTPTNLQDFDDFMMLKGYDPADTTPAAILGRAAAQSVMDFRTNDGSNRLGNYADTTGYIPTPATTEGRWHPLVIGGVTQTALTPHWQLVTPFALSGTEQFRPEPPAEPGSARWINQITQIIQISANLTDRQKVIAEYWRPQRGTPPMLLAELTAQVSFLKEFGLDEDVKLFFAIHNAMFDAGIACWECKYFFDYERPVTAIRRLGDLQIQAWGGPNLGTQTIAAEDFLPYQRLNDPTPPFPEYTSGHSTFSSSWAEIMRSFTESDFFGGSVEIDTLAFEAAEFDPPIKLEWPSFTAAAEEAGISRLYGGIHWMDGNRAAVNAGTLVGKTVWNKVQGLFNGNENVVSDPRVDIDHDGTIGPNDLLLLQENWQKQTN